MDFAFIQKVIPMYAEAALLTFQLALAGILLSFLLGLVCALIKYFKIPVLQRIVGAYIELSRNTPLLIQLFFLYFAFPRMGIKLSSVQCAIIGLTFLGGSYMEETFRSALESVSKIQVESAQCIGLTSRQVTQYVILPQAISVSVPGFCANVMFLIKETSVFSAVALADLMYVAKDLIGLYYKTDEALTLLCVSYFFLLLPISVIASFAERRLRYAQFGNR
ncbi:amino acid ABC transporter permease [Treponema ruminis]|uniref:Polar amino acid transport system permease protein n=1 Tax=Treponema ruminis TaxID=744515 RepID=A0A7W8LLE7_9SPIR|nr:amino acid ABC transporter permease [Treponema ruminis]MBB5225349.1 polar amino acid transport system permease protein [Treponema ruminis]QSI01780.1 amino acid ABC transporter permease [Treponema ruminis]